MPSTKRNLFGTSLALFGATTAAAALVAGAQGGPTRVGALSGVAVAAVASASALFLLALAFDRGIKLVVGALAAGFLLRMMLVAAGILLAIALRGDTLAFAVAFFALYLAHQAIELTVVVRRARPAAAEGPA